MATKKKSLGKRIVDGISRVQEVALCVVRKWWRPITAIGIAGSMIVHGIVLPLILMEPPDLMGLAALVTAAAGAFAVREWGKAQGNENYTETVDEEEYYEDDQTID